MFSVARFRTLICEESGEDKLMGGDEQKRSGKLKTVLEIIFLICTIAGSAKAVLYAAGQLLLDNTAALTIGLLVIVGIFWLALLVIYFSKKPNWARRFALIGMIAIPMVMILCIIVTLRPSSKTVILVAGFDGLEPET